MADLESRYAPCIVKTLFVMLIVGIVLAQWHVSGAAPSENTNARDLAAAKSFAFGGIGVAGLTSEGEACVGVIVPRIRKSSIPWRVQTMTLKSRADV